MNPTTYSVLFLSFFFIPLAVFSIVAIFARPIHGGPDDPRLLPLVPVTQQVDIAALSSTPPRLPVLFIPF